MAKYKIRIKRIIEYEGVFESEDIVKSPPPLDKFMVAKCTVVDKIKESIISEAPDDAIVHPTPEVFTLGFRESHNAKINARTGSMVDKLAKQATIKKRDLTEDLVNYIIKSSDIRAVCAKNSHVSSGLVRALRTRDASVPQWHDLWDKMYKEGLVSMAVKGQSKTTLSGEKTDLLLVNYFSNNFTNNELMHKFKININYLKGILTGIKPHGFIHDNIRKKYPAYKEGKAENEIETNQELLSSSEEQQDS